MTTGRFSVGLVGPLPPPHGGMANQTRQLAGLLKKDGVRVELIQVNAPYRPGFVAHFRGVRALARLLPYLGRLWRMAGRVDLIHVMANSGWSWHLFAAPAVWIAKLRGRPVVVNYRGGEAGTFLRRSLRWVAPTLKRADAIVVPSGFLEGVFRDHGFAPKVVPNVVDLARFTKRPGSPGEATRQRRCHLLVTRNLEPLYDNATAIRALDLIRARLPEARLTLAGTGPEEGPLRALAAELGLSDAVTFAGAVDNEGMPALYQSADVALNPSLVDNTPISVLEALASGVPVVSTNVGGIPYLVTQDESALLVPPNSPRAMAEATLKILEDGRLAGRLVSAGQLIVRRHGWSAVRSALLATYEGALGQPLRGGHGT
ncbi:MAG: glycosyltransferase family 4 protein [Betaproteobacteria bacterium]|nr:glycosyltransferase family 4 protein [Betaproteobacteria bacterium]